MKRNQITNLQKGNGEWCSDNQQIIQEVCRYYEDMYTTSQPGDMEEVLEGVSVSITSRLNQTLIQPVEEDEVRAVVFAMTPLFFQRYRNDIKTDVVSAIQSFLSNGHLLKSINETSITLIPKVENPISLANYRPINLCNVLYRIIAKILANKLKKVIALCISSSQSAFVPDRQINNVKNGVLSYFCKMDYELQITGLKLSRNEPVLSHLFFADDSLFCCKAHPQEARAMQRIVAKYELASGRCINYDKSAAFFSRNCSRQQRKQTCEKMNNIKEANSGKYLGLPLVIAASKKQVFAHIVDKAKSKMQGWKHNLLSYAGKEVKGNGGLGFRDLEHFNSALLAKQLWRILMQPYLLVSRVLGAKYKITQTGWDGEAPRNASWVWKSIYSSGLVLQKGIRKRVGDGTTINIWRDKWIMASPTGRIATQKPPACDLQTVADLLIEREWNKKLIEETFSEQEASQILQMPLNLFPRKDTVY
ncbi:uncharacterized protein [Coffea arabica]|uniref:Reverse transcriptase domain-containing protein n=1 Tax=Coffea arabica TaxID=13443 RepID=A0ABM4X0T7_COFAR